jgi:acyl-CoA dehydrogenase
MLSARLGDVMSYLYASMAVIRHYEQKVSNRNEAKPFFEYAIQWTLQQAEVALVDFIDNFPSWPAKILMRVLTNTYTRSTHSISDRLKQELSTASMQPGATMDEITHLVKAVAGDGNDINHQAFIAKHKVMPQLKKIQKALRTTPVIPFISFEHAVGQLHQAGELTADELALVLDYNDKRKRAVRVDEYTYDLDLLDENQQLVDPNKEINADAA